MLLHNPWRVQISKTVIVTKAVILPYLVEGESGFTYLFYSSLQGINSTGEKTNGCMLNTMLLKARQSKML